MNKLLTGIALSICGSAFCASSPQIQKKEVTNYASGKCFYRKHVEENYDYTTCGYGFEYLIDRPEGLNLKFSVITSMNISKDLLENENQISYKIPLKDDSYVSPFGTTRFSSHKINSSESEDFFIRKSAAFIGVKLGKTWMDHTSIEVDFSVFRDMKNALHVQDGNTFRGNLYSNPYGGKGLISIGYCAKDKVYLNIEAYYAKTFKECYTEHGIEFSFKVGF